MPVTNLGFQAKAKLLPALFAGLIVLPVMALAGPQPADPQPAAAALKDGLSVNYYFAKFNHIRELETWMKYKDGKAGTPLPALDYKSGLEDDILTSSSDNLVGAHIRGYINLDKPGVYHFRVTSNDGVRVNLGGETIYEDPDVHKDRTGDPVAVDVTTPGLYPLEVFYFEKKEHGGLEARMAAPWSQRLRDRACLSSETPGRLAKTS